MVLQNGLNEYVNRLKAVRALFDSSVDPVTRNEFEAFTQPLLIGKRRHRNAVVGAAHDSIPNAPSTSAPASCRVFRATASRPWVPTAISFRLPSSSEYFPVFYATLPINVPAVRPRSAVRTGETCGTGTSARHRSLGLLAKFLGWSVLALRRVLLVSPCRFTNADCLMTRWRIGGAILQGLSTARSSQPR